MPQRFKSTLILSAAVAVSLMSASQGRSAPPGKGGQIPSGPGLIAFTERGDSGAWINVMHPDGTGRTRVAFADKSYAGPAWSRVFADGTVKLAWGDHDGVSRSFLVIADVPLNGGPIVPMEIPTTPENLPGSDHPDSINELDWSRPVALGDGTGRQSVRISYQTSAKYPPDEKRLIWVIVSLIYQPATEEQPSHFTMDGSVPPVVLDPGPGDDYWEGRFSPDGTMLALCRYESGDEKSIWLAQSDGSNLKLLIPHVPGSKDWSPAWSPDGTKLAFVSNRDGSAGGNIHLAALVGQTFEELDVTSITRLTRSKSGCFYRALDWSPDGTQIAYINSWNFRSIRVCKMMLATGTSFDLAEGTHLDWSPFE